MISNGAPAAQVNSVAKAAAASRMNSLPSDDSSKKTALNDLLKSSVYSIERKMRDEQRWG